MGLRQDGLIEQYGRSSMVRKQRLTNPIHFGDVCAGILDELDMPGTGLARHARSAVPAR